MKNKILELAYESEAKEDFKENLKEFIDDLIHKLDSIPDECKQSATIDISKVFDYDEIATRINVRYLRDETDAEYEKRIAEEERRKNRVEIEEKQTYERLKRKFEEGKS